MLKFRSALVRFLFLSIISFSICPADVSAQWSSPSSEFGEASFYSATGITKLYGDIGGYVSEKFLLSDFNTSFALGFRYTTPFRVGFSGLMFKINDGIFCIAYYYYFWCILRFMNKKFAFIAVLVPQLRMGKYLISSALSVCLASASF